MDEFVQSMHDYCCVGGIHCPCCNDFKYGKERKKLRRLARRKLKREVVNLIEKQMETVDED